MPFKDKYKTGETFSYKFWHITTTTGGHISFAIDGMSIFLAVSSNLQKSGFLKDIKIYSIIKGAVNDECGYLYLHPVTSINFSHKFFVHFPEWDKYRTYAKNHIDNVLGDGITYGKAHNLFHALKDFV